MSMFCTSSFSARRRNQMLWAGCLAAAIWLSPQVGLAQADSPFTGFAGSWRGSGRVVGTKGNSEPIKCRATYTVSPDGAGLSQVLVCASDTYRFDIRGDVVTDGSSVHGTWHETTRDATGDFVGHVRDGLFEGSVSSPNFTARLSVRATGGKQIVSIDPQGTDIAKVDITMTH